jgi:hypothetical protein
MKVADALEQIIALGDVPDDLLPDITAAIKDKEKAEFISKELLCDILIATKSEDIYDIVRSKKDSLNIWSLLKLFENGFLPEIEESLCTKLFDCYENSAAPERRLIVEAFEKNGSKQTLDLLKTIKCKMAESIQGRKYSLSQLKEEDPESPAFIQVMGIKIDEEFLPAVNKAISAIEGRQ